MVAIPAVENGFVKKAKLLADEWPHEMRLMASRKWDNIVINGDNTELQTTFFRSNLSDEAHDLINVFLEHFDVHEFETWLGITVSKLMSDDLDVDWFTQTRFITSLKNRFDVQIHAMLTFPADAPIYGQRSMHVGFILAQA